MRIMLERCAGLRSGAAVGLGPRIGGRGRLAGWREPFPERSVGREKDRAAFHGFLGASPFQIYRGDLLCWLRPGGLDQVCAYSRNADASTRRLSSKYR